MLSQNATNCDQKQQTLHFCPNFRKLSKVLEFFSRKKIDFFSLKTTTVPKIEAQKCNKKFIFGGGEGGVRTTISPSQTLCCVSSRHRFGEPRTKGGPQNGTEPKRRASTRRENFETNCEKGLPLSKIRVLRRVGFFHFLDSF